MQMSFFDFEEFNELKAEAKKKEAPRKKKEEKQKKKSAPKTVYKLPLTLKSIAGDLVMTEGTGTEEEVKQFLAEQGPFFAICDVSKKEDAYLCRPKNHEGVEKGTITVDGMQVFFGAEAVDVTALTGEVDLTNLFEYAPTVCFYFFLEQEQLFGTLPGFYGIKITPYCFKFFSEGFIVFICLKEHVLQFG